MALAVLAQTFCTEDDIKHLLSPDGELARLDDDGDSYVNAYEQVTVTSAINYATTRVNFYCQVLYDSDQLATSWLVNEWATIIASRWMCSRRNNPVPTSLEEMYKAVIDDMKLVRAMQMQIPDIGYRNATWPAWSNISKSDGYRYRKLRVERPISEKSPTQYPQSPDWNAEFTWEI
jgi:hypothetical protein